MNKVIVKLCEKLLSKKLGWRSVLLHAEKVLLLKGGGLEWGNSQDELRDMIMK